MSQLLATAIWLFLLPSIKTTKTAMAFETVPLFSARTAMTRLAAEQERIVPNDAAIDSMFGPRVDDGPDVVLFSDEDYNDDDDDDDDEWGAPVISASPSSAGAAPSPKKKASRWDSLNPKIKSRIVKEAQERAIRNKKKREPAADKKRRLYAQYKQMQQQSKRALRVSRPTPLSQRTPLSSFSPGDGPLPGKVISLTPFGAYVDIGSEVDGLLHVSQITRDHFVDHPRQVLSLGMEIEVTVVRVSHQLKKLQLTMLPPEILHEENPNTEILSSSSSSSSSHLEEDDRIQLHEIETDDELWGEIRRVTDYGAYIELGAVVRGFLHFMDHPLFPDYKGKKPNEFMKVGERVRVWVMDVDMTQNRIKLTANRPMGLPGPKREIQWIQ